jgi:hypothetical protein
VSYGNAVPPTRVPTGKPFAYGRMFPLLPFFFTEVPPFIMSSSIVLTDADLPSDFALPEIDTTDMPCYFCGLHMGKEQEDLTGRIRRFDSTINCSVLGRTGAFFNPVVYVRENGEPIVAHDNCLQWGEGVWLTAEINKMSGVEQLLKNCESYTCNLCGTGTRASVACSGVKCANMKDASTYHFPCILLLFMNKMADMDTCRGPKQEELAIRCTECYVNKRNKKRCRFLDHGAQEAEEHTPTKAKVKRSRRIAKHQDSSDDDLAGL